jgi:hypothetical protein
MFGFIKKRQEREQRKLIGQNIHYLEPLIGAAKMRNEEAPKWVLEAYNRATEIYGKYYGDWDKKNPKLMNIASKSDFYRITKFSGEEISILLDDNMDCRRHFDASLLSDLRTFEEYVTPTLGWDIYHETESEGFSNMYNLPFRV